MALLNVKDLACYICHQYKEESTISKDISPIKLQKALYFLFAFWGGFIRKGKNSNVEQQIDLDENLFDELIEAWVYGPVVPDVFSDYKNGKIDCESVDYNSIFSMYPTVLKETIDSLLHDIFRISDFKLVSLSHEDKCWSRNFIENQSPHDKEIPKNEIIEEYASR